MPLLELLSEQLIRASIAPTNHGCIKLKAAGSAVQKVAGKDKHEKYTRSLGWILAGFPFLGSSRPWSPRTKALRAWDKGEEVGRKR